MDLQKVQTFVLQSLATVVFYIESVYLLRSNILFIETDNQQRKKLTRCNKAWLSHYKL